VCESMCVCVCEREREREREREKGEIARVIDGNLADRMKNIPRFLSIIFVDWKWKGNKGKENEYVFIELGHTDVQSHKTQWRIGRMLAFGT